MKGRLIGITVTACLVGAAAAIGSLSPKEACIGGYSTSLAGRSTDQRHNAVLSAEALNGAVLLPGKTFSFNERVGTFSRDAGFRKAPVSYNGTLIDSWGGGVCQTSTTFYNAALLAGLPIVERNRHRFWPSYITPGRDAAVAFGQIDLKVSNDLLSPVRVEAKVDGEALVVRLHSVSRHSGEVEILSNFRQINEARSYRIGDGQRSRIRNKGKDGVEVETYRVMNGQRSLLSVDSYPPMHRITEFR